ncbi:MAG: DUF1974 domain-containing protein [bacterium]|nr:DUF1974 domain-containing protein [bacterium]
MNRIFNLWPAVIIAAPLAAVLLLFGIERLSLNGSRGWVKLALAVNTCLLLFTSSVFATDRYEQIDCYEVGYVPDDGGDIKPDTDPLINEFRELNDELDAMIESGIFDEAKYDSVRNKVEARTEALVAAGVISDDEAAEVRAFFESRLNVYLTNDVRPMCYKG